MNALLSPCLVFMVHIFSLFLKAASRRTRAAFVLVRREIDLGKMRLRKLPWGI